MSAARILMWLSCAAGIFLAFAWPFAVGFDPASEAFHAIAVAVVVVFFASLAGALAARR